MYVEFNLDQFEGPRWLAWKFVNASGWLQVIEVTMATPIGWQSRTYAIGCNDEGVTMPSWESDFLLDLPAKLPMPTQNYPPDELSAIAEISRNDFMGECDRLSLEALEGLEDETRSKLQHLDQVLKLATDHLGALRSELRSFLLAADRRIWINGEIERLENEEMRAGGVFADERKRIRQAAEARETALIESLSYEADVEVLYTVQFEARMRGREKQIAWPLIEEETFSPGWSQERAQQALKDHLEDAATRRTEEAAQSAQDAADEAEWLADAKRKKAEAAKQPPAVTKRKPNPAPKKVITFKPKPQPKVAPKPAEKPVTQKPLTDAEERAQDVGDNAEWIANAKRKKLEAAVKQKNAYAAAKQKKAEVEEQPPAYAKRKPNLTPKEVITFKQTPLPTVAPKPAEKPVIQKPLTDAEEHTALRAEVASLSDILRHSGRSTFETKQGLWRVTRRKQPQGDELQAIYHAIGQTDGEVKSFPRILGFLAPAPAQVAVVRETERPAESTVSAWARGAEQLEQIAKTRRILSPKSKIALGKLKSGRTALSETDINAMKHLIAQLKKTGFDVDGFLAVK